MIAWWRKAVFYEIYISSFYDSNNDGIGDLKGIILKLDYLVKLGIDAIWLTPFYESPKVDNGYDISDFKKIDSDYGRMSDFEFLIKEAHNRNIKVIVDIVLNHTSDKHPWFIESRSSKDNPKRDWYIWANGNIPNNWESFFSGSAWELDKTTDSYYYHAFSKEQVDLNWSNPEVVEAMLDVLKFWLEKGVDGFRLDVINFLTTNGILEDNPYDEDDIQIHEFDVNQKDIYQIIRKIREYVDTFDNKVLVGEVGSEDFKKINSFQGEDLLDLVFNFNLGSIETFDINKIYHEIKSMDTLMDTDLPTLFFGSHDMARVASRFGFSDSDKDRAKCIATLMLTTRGVPFIYFGEEIGMKDLFIKSVEDMNDIRGISSYYTALDDGKNPEEALIIANAKCRDKSRSPMQWSNEKHGGFSDSIPWINMSTDYKKSNVLSQFNSPDSVLNYYIKLLGLRNRFKTLTEGCYNAIEIKDQVMFYIREYQDEQIFVIINFGSKEYLLDKIGFDCNWLVSSQRDQILSSEINTILSNESLIGIEL